MSSDIEEEKTNQGSSILSGFENPSIRAQRLADAGLLILKVLMNFPDFEGR